MLRPPVHPAALGCLALCLAAVACSGPPPEQMPLGELLPVMRTVVPVTDLFSDTGDAALLGIGTQVRESTGFGRLLVVRGHRAEVGFQATGRADLAVYIQMRRAPGDAASVRTFAVHLNGHEALSGEVPSQWERFVTEIPASEVRTGVNRLVLDFSVAPEDPTEEPIVPARIRWIQIAPAGRSVPWTERPTEVVADADGNMVMPVDSLAELAVALPGPARLRGSLVASPAPGQRARSLRVSVRLLPGAALDAEGSPASGQTSAAVDIGEETLLDTTVMPGVDDQTLDLDLSPSAGRLVRLRLLVEGPGNGTVTWANLRLEHPPGVRPEPLARTPATPGQPPASGTFAGRSVVVVVLDAARADAYSAYGADRRTPAIDSLAEDGILFERAWAPAPWTAPSVSSLLTGLYADTHGVEAWDRGLAKPVSTLGEYFRSSGYRTVIWSQHLLYRTNPTLRRGFDEIHDVDPEQRQVLPPVGDLLDPDRPTFLLVHLLVPHAPYDPPSPWANRYADTEAPDGIEPADPTFAHPFQRVWDPQEPSAQAIAYLRDRYDEMVAWSDALVGELVDRLRDSGAYEDALVVLVGDHGEAFWEHGSFLHTRLLNQEVLRVPLIVKLPGARRSGERWNGTVSVADVAATLVDAAGVSPPPRLSEADATVGMQGRSLLPALLGEGGVAPEAYATTRASLFRREPGRRRLAVEAHGHKLLLDTVWGDMELYAPSTDPVEAHDLAAARPVLALWLRQAAMAQHVLDRTLEQAYMGADPTGTDLDLSDLEALEALGYIQ